jgi:hypothetical protein
MNAKTFADGLKELATKKRSKNKATIGSQGGWYVYEEREEMGGKAGKGRLSPSLSLSLSLSWPPSFRLSLLPSLLSSGTAFV